MHDTTKDRIFDVNAMMEEIQPRDKLLVTREATHGSFLENAKVSQGVKEWLRTSPGWRNLSDVEREVMDMIALKFSRVLAGKSLSVEHWEDVVGYAKLALEQCK